MNWRIKILNISDKNNNEKREIEKRVLLALSKTWQYFNVLCAYEKFEGNDFPEFYFLNFYNPFPISEGNSLYLVRSRTDISFHLIFISITKGEQNCFPRAILTFPYLHGYAFPPPSPSSRVRTKKFLTRLSFSERSKIVKSRTFASSLVFSYFFFLSLFNFLYL